MKNNAHHPMGIGRMGRVDHMMGQLLFMGVNQRRNDWDEHLNHVEGAFHNPVAALTGLGPKKAHLGRLPCFLLTGIV